MGALFIPKKIRVGFQEREGTYTGKLAYVIYYDIKGKLRKEPSWQSWRDDKIKPLEFDNTRQDGFHLNKGVQRYNWSHFGSNRSYIRIFDARGIEFEITPENLIALLTETTCSKRGLDGDFVYAWHGDKLVLLPCSSEAYTEAVKNTERQGQKVSARDLKPGCSYTTKKGEEVIYMGRFSWFTWDRGLWYDRKSTGRISRRRHVFARLKAYRGWGTKPKAGEHEFFPKGDASFLAELNSEDPVHNYATLVDQFNGDVHSSVLEKWKTRPFNPTEAVIKLKNDGYGRFLLGRTVFTEMVDDKVVFWRLTAVYKGYPNKDVLRGYSLTEEGALDTKKLLYESRSRYYHYSVRNDDSLPVLSKQELFARLAEFVEVDAVLSSGKKLRIRDIDTLKCD